MKKQINKNTDSYLEERINHLEGVERFVIDSLETAASLGDFQSSINKLRDIITILEETRIKVQGLIPFETVAFFLVDEESNDFTLRHIDSENHRSYIQSEVDHSIDNGIFAWALTEKRPVIVPTKDNQKSLVLHSMATATRIRGMFVGVMNNDAHGLRNVSFSLVSLILFNSANAIESCKLYSKIREINRSMERIDNYKLLFEAAPDGVEVVDKGGYIIDSNDAEKKLLGYRQEQLTGSLSVHYFSEKSRASLLNYPASLNEEGYWEGEVELVTATGKIISVWRKEKAIYDNDHRFIGAVVYNRDITERKRAEEEKTNLEIQLFQSQKMQAIGTLAGGIAHDFNNILSVIIGYTELARDRNKKENKEKYLQEALNGAQRAKNLVKQILTFSRQDDPTEKKPLDIKVLLKEAIKFLRSSIPSTIEIDQQLTGEECTIMADPTQMHQIIMNLCTNASHAMKETGGTLTIELTTPELGKDDIPNYPDLRPGHYVKLTVSDTGYGIDPAIVQRIFDPFFTTKSIDEGTGLGLSVVYGIVKNHGGVINVYSEQGKGAAFHIYLPRIIQAEAMEVDTGKPVIGGTERILFVDDEPSLVDIAKSTLSSLGYDVTGVLSSVEALDMVSAEPQRFDLVITDMTLPKMTGLDLSRKLLQIRPDIPIILCSGIKNPDTEAQAKSLGIKAYLAKPLTKKELAGVMRDVLDGEEKMNVQ